MHSTHASSPTVCRPLYRGCRPTRSKARPVPPGAESQAVCRRPSRPSGHLPGLAGPPGSALNTSQAPWPWLWVGHSQKDVWKALGEEEPEGTEHSPPLQAPPHQGCPRVLCTQPPGPTSQKHPVLHPFAPQRGLECPPSHMPCPLLK